MKIVIAPDSFKDGLDALKTAKTLFKTFNKIKQNYIYKKIPISDGGENILKVLTPKRITTKVTGPLGVKTKAQIGFLNDNKTVVIEMALAAGIEKIKQNKRNANYTTTYGVGELLIEALKYNPEKIILGLGGSATNDLGIGALKALGLNFYDEKNKETGIYGKDIFKIKKISSTNINKKLLATKLILATDVKNTLLGKDGSTFTYGPQKGLKEEDLIKYDKQFEYLSKLLNDHFNKDFTNTPGSGAAGGISYSLATVFNAEIKNGFELVYNELKIEEELKNANYLITSEGKVDSQSLKGKAPYQIALLAKEINKDIKVVLFTGTNDLKDNNIFDEIIEINDSKISLNKNIKRTKKHLIKEAKSFIKSI